MQPVISGLSQLHIVLAGAKMERVCPSGAEKRKNKKYDDEKRQVQCQAHGTGVKQIPDDGRLYKKERDTQTVKLPELHRDSLSRQRHPSGTHHSYRLGFSDKKDRKYFLQSPCNIHRVNNMEQNEYFQSPRVLGKTLPPIPPNRLLGLSNVTKSQHQEIRNVCFPTLNDQAAVRQQQKTVRKLDPISSSLLTGRKQQDQEEKQTGLPKEEDEDVKKNNTRDSTRRDRSHLKHERRENKEGFDQLKEKQLQSIELPPEAYPDAPQRLIPCNLCSRYFDPDRLETHVRVCEKGRPERKVFDTAFYRNIDTANEKFLKATNSWSKMQKGSRTIDTHVTLY